MYQFPTNCSDQNRGYYVFIHEDDSPVENLPELPSINGGNDSFEWDEEVVEESHSTPEDDTWTSLYSWYAQMLEQTGEQVKNSNSIFRGVDVKQRGAAHYAAEQGHVGVLRLLLKTDCKMDLTDSDGLTPLHMAVKCGQTNAAEFLLAANANPNRQILHWNNYTPLHVAASHGYTDMINILIAAGAMPEARDNNERTPLHLAADQNQTQSVIRLLELGSNTNVEDIHGATPLCNAVWKESIENVNAFLSTGARIPAHHYLLHHAVYTKQTEIVRSLLKYGSNVNMRDTAGDTPLILAVRNGQIDIVHLLLDNGASVDYPNSLTGSTALHEAVGCLNFQMFRELFVCLQNHNVNLNAICFSGGDTPLFRAILLKRDQTAKFLIKHGADVNLCSLQYCVVDNLTLAITLKNTSVANLLVLAGAHPPKEWKYGPRSLAHCARLVIRNCLPTNNMCTSIQDLPLPTILKSFLMFENEDC